MAESAGGKSGGLSKLGILVAQLESIVASASLKAPDSLLCFDLLFDLLATIHDEPKECIVSCQRKCEEALQALVLLGARPPVRRLAARALVDIIGKGDNISIYARASSFQGWLSDTKRIDSLSCIGAANCLGALYRSYGQKISSGLMETSNIVTKLMKHPEVGVRQAALQLVQDALQGSGGGGPFIAYTDALRAVSRVGATDRSPVVRATAAECLRAFAMTGGPGLGPGALENCAALCVKALEDSSQLVRDAFASALGSLVALGLNPEAQVQPRGKVQISPAKTLEGGLQKHLIGPFMGASGTRYKDVRVGLTMAWVAFLQAMRLTYFRNELELESFALQAMSMLTFNSKSTIDAHSQACVLYILRVGIVEQMSEPAQKDFLILLTKQLSMADTSASMLVVILRTVSHLLITLGEVSSTSREALENSLVATLSNPSIAVRVEAALTIRALAEVDPMCTNSLMSCGVTTLRALRETVAIEKGDRLRLELDSLHGQSAMLAALLAVSPKLLLGVPSRLPSSIFGVAKVMVLEQERNLLLMGATKESGWLLVAAIVSSMPVQELQEQEFDLLALWTVPFGGNFEDRLRKAQSNLPAEICGWSAAVEALTAFIKSYIVPNLSPSAEGILLQPVLGYLSGALAYLSSPILQQVPMGLKQSVNIFTIRTLSAYQALPDPLMYKNDQGKLLALCTSPFRDPSNWAESSSLRQLLDARDASLGPWVPGRDSFEDELRAFEGGLDGPLPCVWEEEIYAFPQPVSVSSLLVNRMLLCFGTVFAVQTEAIKLQLLDVIEGSTKYSRKQSWHGSNTTNICVALLAALKSYLQFQSTLGIRVDCESEVLRRMQSIFQCILAEELASAAHRRAAAEGLGILARLGGDVFAARMMRTLLIDAERVLDFNWKGSLAVALGCIQRSVGGMALSVLVPSTVETLCTMARDPKDVLHIWSLHGLWLTIEAAGLSYVSFVQVTMSLAMEILLSEEHAGPVLRQCIGRLVNAIVAVIGPELSPESWFFNRCKSVVLEISSKDEPAALLESVLFIQQLVFFAPQALSVHAHVQSLIPTLSSKQPSLRQAAVSTLRHLAERDPVSIGKEQIEEYLFAMLDTETDAGIVNLVRLTLARLLEAACPFCPSRWLKLCRNVVLATSATLTAGVMSGESEPDPTIAVDAGDYSQDFTRDDEGMIIRSNKGSQLPGSFNSLIEDDGIAKEGEQLPRYRTRVFAAECLSRLPIAVGSDQRHFDLSSARIMRLSSRGNDFPDFLVFHLTDLVAVAYQIATGSFESMRPLGILLLATILDKFGRTEDPDYPGHLLLEQYQAQLVSAIRTALGSSAGPLLLDSGLRLAMKMITSGISNHDAGVLSRLFTLISRPLNSVEDLRYPSYAEWVGCKVQITVLSTHAAIKNYASSCMNEYDGETNEGAILSPLLEKYSSLLNCCWMALLRDYLLLRLFSCSQLQSKYRPFLEGIMSPAVFSVVQPYLNEIWPVILGGVILDVSPLAFESSTINVEARGITYEVVALKDSEFNELWALCLLTLSENDAHIVSSCTSFSNREVRVPVASELQYNAFRALGVLCSGQYYRPTMLSVDLFDELLKILTYVALRNDLATFTGISVIVRQVVDHCPVDYLKMVGMKLTLAEFCMNYIHKILDSIHSSSDLSSDIGVIVSSTLETISKLLVHFSNEEQFQLALPLLSTAVRIANVVPTTGNAMSNALGFIAGTSTLISKSLATIETNYQDKYVTNQTAFLLITVIQSLIRLSNQLIISCNISKDVKESETFLQKLPLLLDTMLSVAQIIPDITSDSQMFGLISKDKAVKACIDCIHSAMSDSNVQVQLGGLQALRMLAQGAINKQNDQENSTFALFVLKELGTDILHMLYDSLKVTLTSAVAVAIGETLKILLLMLSLIADEDAQQEILHLLLPAMLLSVSSFTNNSSQVAAGLKTVVVKLITHLSTEFPTQFKTVLLELPIELRQILQDVIIASFGKQGPRPILSVASPPIIAQKLVVPSIPSNAKDVVVPPVSSTGQQPTIANHENGKDDDEFGKEDDDWDDFQSYPAPASCSSVKHDDESKIFPDESQIQTGHDDEDDNHQQETPSQESSLTGVFAPTVEENFAPEGATETNKESSLTGLLDPTAEGNFEQWEELETSTECSIIGSLAPTAEETFAQEEETETNKNFAEEEIQTNEVQIDS